MQTNYRLLKSSTFSLFVAGLLSFGNAAAFDFGGIIDSVVDKAVNKTIDRTSEKVTDSVSNRVSDNVDQRVNSAMDRPATVGSPAMSMGDMSMEQAMEMQACFGNIDPKYFERLEKEGQQFESRIKSLCSSGRRSLAQQEAITKSKEIWSSSEVQAVMKCGEPMKRMMPKLYSEDFSDPSKNSHVCDEI